MLDPDKYSHKVIGLSIGYTFVVCALYLWGYWGSFGINIMQFISLSDIPRIAAYPLLASVLTFTAGALFNISTGVTLPDGEGKNTPTGKFLNRHSNYIIPILLAIQLAFYFLGNHWKMVIICFICTLQLAFYCAKNDTFSKLFPSIRIPNAAITIIITTLTMSFGIGKIEANHLIYGTNNTTATINNTQDKMIYIGHAGDYLFLLTQDKSTTIIIRNQEATMLSLQMPSSSRTQ